MQLAWLGALVALMLPFPSRQEMVADRLYGRVHTADGEVVEGFLRWDRNEASPDDFLDARKEIPADLVREAERLDPDFARRQREARSLVAFGMRITWEEDDLSDPPSAAVSLRFAHIASIGVLDDNSATVVLRSGEEVTLRSSSSDLGRGMRELVVERYGMPDRSFRWRELERVDFFVAPDEAPPPEARRLHGTVVTWGDLELTGDIAWDVDEVLSTDVLDGRDGAEDVELPFGEIERIEQDGPRRVRVTLQSGTERTLRGSNDVNRANRGIEVSDPALGKAVVRWDDFRSLRLHAPVEGPAGGGSLEDFAPGALIRGTVHALDGRVLEGAVRWGVDEERLWESLDGWHGDTRVSVEFGRIASIRRLDEERVAVSLTDGRELVLEDVYGTERLHDGIFVTPEGRATRLVRWQDFDRLEISR